MSTYLKKRRVWGNRLSRVLDNILERNFQDRGENEVLVTDIKYLSTKAGFLIDYKIMNRKWLQYLDIQKHLVKTSIGYSIHQLSLRKNICLKSSAIIG